MTDYSPYESITAEQAAKLAGMTVSELMAALPPMFATGLPRYIAGDVQKFITERAGK